MRKRVIGSIVACAAVGLAFLGLAACDKSPAGTEETPDGGDGTKLAQVDVSTISVREEVLLNGKLGTTFSWGEVENAESYEFTCNGSTITVSFPPITLQNYSQITIPADGVFNVSIVAKAEGYTASDPISYTYTVRGCELNGLSLTSFDNGILKWEADPLATGYTVSVNGGAAIPVTTNEFDLGNTQYSGALHIEICAAGDGLFTKTSAPLSVNVNAAHTKLQLTPVTDYTVSDGVVGWKPVAGVTKYRIVDIERNSKITEELTYDYSENLPLYGVYPISNSEFIDDASVNRVSIPYLDGLGTSSAPYKIKSPIDFRAIDYYEANYAERLAEWEKAGSTGTKPLKTYYTIENNIDFDAVGVPDDASNFYPMTQPFYGMLNGGGMELGNIRVRHRSGYFAMFDYIAPEGIVMNIKFVSPDMENEMINNTLPINASIATVAYKNYGTIADITVRDAAYKTAGGEIAGVCWQNNGTVQRCVVNGNFEQRATGQSGQACYEMAGIVAENYGNVKNNTVKTLEIRGTAIPTDSKPYNNVRCAAGIVAVNRTGGKVTGNTFENLSMTTVLDATDNEFGGIVAYNAPGATVAKGNVTFGTFKHNGNTVSSSKEVGTKGSYLGTLIGKNQGTKA